MAADNSVFLLGDQDDDGTTGSDFATIKLDADGGFLWEWTVRLILEKSRTETILLRIVLTVPLFCQTAVFSLRP